MTLEHSRSDRRGVFTRRRMIIGAAALATAALALTGCAPGSSVGNTKTTGSISTTLTTKKVVLKIDDETGFPLTSDLAKEFTKQHPNVTFKIVRDSFQNLTANTPRLLAAADAPDLIRQPTIGDTVKDGLLLNLDPYFKAYGWDKWPSGQLAPLRQTKSGVRGSGSLYQLGLGYSVTGIYINEKLAQKAGITSAPTTLDEFEADLAQAKAAGVLPIETGMQDGVGTFAYQAIEDQYANTQELLNWEFNKPGARFDTPAALKAATIFQDWAKKGYLPSDVNAINYTTMVGNFEAGQGVFMFDGNWDAAGVQKALGTGNAQFVLFPGTTSSSKFVAMGAANSFDVPAKAKNAATAVYFLNWLHTNKAARQIVTDVSGASPGGDPSEAQPKVASTSLIAEALKASAQVGKDNGFVDFIANTTAGIYAGSLQPEEQQLLVSKITPQQFVTAVQQYYVNELKG